ncbi:hypothetical protein HFP15_00325 [Amycolatopsis sp. K13G38]|uniref:LamG domain-containing protein n=1 Tax=Amycolatopsis acididurans TaxID=2724524 RepID=A0ABX1IYZ3_9PSEU|nr:LamG-like jellyroll fold domain-containing protein [Amycolatopsis acididurans]NKQ51325.1 hypothetical protein [Amycolatopsis acididurans]
MDRVAGPGGLGRRALLQAAAAAPVAIAASQAVARTPAEAGENGRPADSASPRFTLAVFPDTQYLLHIAVVNDGHHTSVYVDGSKIARNASLDSNGISTVGKPFAIGGTQGGGQYGQGFYGWIGDTRIVARALSPGQFMRSR